MKFKIGLVLLSVMMLLAGCGGNSEEGNAANNYPERNIEVLVGHGAGGGTDLFARAVTSELEDILGVNINVVNQEGGAGVVAAQNAYNAPSDGYTLVGMLLSRLQ